MLEARKCIQEDVEVPDVTQCALESVHAAEEVRIVGREQRLNHLGRVAETLEGDPGPMDAELILIVHLPDRFGGLGEEEIHCR